MIKLSQLVKEIMEAITNPPAPPAIVQQLPTINTNAIADAIYRAEGGDKTRFPYGISRKKSGIQTLSKEDARKICINTVGHAYHDWVMTGHKGDFIDFLSKKYCSENSTNWAKMIKSIMASQKKK